MEDSLAAHQPEQPAIDEVRQHHAGDVHREKPAIGLWRHLVVVDVDEGRADDEGVGAGVEETAGKRVADQPRVADQLQVGGEGTQQRLAGALLARQAFGQREQRDEGRQADAGQGPEDPLPRPPVQDLPAEQRPGEGRDAHDQDQRRKHPRRLLAAIEVAHHGSRKHRPDTSAQCLHHAPEHHLRHRGRHRAAGGTDAEQDHAQGDRALAAIAVADRPPEQLADAEADEEGGEGQLDAGDTGVQFAADGRQRRQVHVRRDRGERHQRAENQQQAQLADRAARRGSRRGRNGGVRGFLTDGHRRDLCRILPQG